MTGIFEFIKHFFLTGTLVNFFAVIVGAVLGSLVGNKIPAKICASVMNALALCVMLIGLTGCLLPKTFTGDDTSYTQNILLIILSVIIGTIFGELLDLDGKVTRLGDRIGANYSADSKIAEGFVSGTLLFCVGAMAIVGSIESGLTGDNSTLFAKSLLDCISAFILASSLGIGVSLSAAAILLYQGTISVIAYCGGSFLSNYMISQMSFVGNLLIVGLSLNMLQITKMKIMNFLPAMFLPILLCLFI